jgi:hypothetical protein
MPFFTTVAAFFSFKTFFDTLTPSSLCSLSKFSFYTSNPLPLSSGLVHFLLLPELSRQHEKQY